MTDRTQTSALAETALTRRQGITLLATTVFGHGLKHVFNSAFFILLPEIKAGLGLTNAQVGTLSAIRFFAGGLANLPAGFLADRFSGRRAQILGVSFALIGVFAFTLGLATTYWVAVATSTLMMVAITFWHPSAISSLSQRFAERRGLAIALHGTGGSIGETLGPALAGVLLGALLWRILLQGSVFPAVLLGALFWALLRTVPLSERGAANTAGYIGSLRRLFGSGRLLLVLGLAGGFAAGQSVFYTFFPLYLEEELGASTVARGLYLSLAQVAGIASQPAMGYVSDRIGRKAVLVPGLVVLGLSLVALYLDPTGWALIAVLAVLGAVLFSLMSILLAAAGDMVEGSVQGTTVSLVFGTAVAISAVVPAVAGYAADTFGLGSTFLLAGAVVLATALVAAATPWQAPARQQRGT